MTKPTALHLVRLVAAAVLALAVVLNERIVAYPRRLAFQLSVELVAAVLALVAPTVGTQPAWPTHAATYQAVGEPSPAP